MIVGQYRVTLESGLGTGISGLEWRWYKQRVLDPYLSRRHLQRLKRKVGKTVCLAVIGVNARGGKHFLAIEDGIRESTQSWHEVLLKLNSRGMNSSELAVGDGAMGSAALGGIYPDTRQ